MYLIKASYGNDSMALIQWMHEQGHGGVSHVVYNDTGWSRAGWVERVTAGEALAASYGMTVHRTHASFVDACRLKRAFPAHGMQFCTTMLKIEPTLRLFDALDPAREWIAVVGVRREESARRAAWPEVTEASPLDGGRESWAPLVRHTQAQRDELLLRAGVQPLPHRSDECWPCVNANRADVRRVADSDPERIAEIDALERELSEGHDVRRRMFRETASIGEHVAWAQSAPRGYVEGQRFLFGCDGGFCGT
jgi:3'-phosphoadenosine 5'-phosphosulfate sulfotransferase (PAPS reductase)/FAD synthetase